MTDPTPSARNRPESGADILLCVTSRTLTRVRRSAVLTTSAGLSLLVAGPASAKVPEGWSDPAPVPVLQALLIAVTLMQLSGPVWALFGLRYAAGEAPKRNPDRSRG